MELELDGATGDLVELKRKASALTQSLPPPTSDVMKPKTAAVIQVNDVAVAQRASKEFTQLRNDQDLYEERVGLNLTKKERHSWQSLLFAREMVIERTSKGPLRSAVRAALEKYGFGQISREGGESFRVSWGSEIDGVGSPASSHTMSARAQETAPHRRSARSHSRRRSTDTVGARAVDGAPQTMPARAQATAPHRRSAPNASSSNWK